GSVNIVVGDMSGHGVRIGGNIIIAKCRDIDSTQGGIEYYGSYVVPGHISGSGNIDFYSSGYRAFGYSNTSYILNEGSHFFDGTLTVHSVGLFASNCTLGGDVVIDSKLIYVNPDPTYNAYANIALSCWHGADGDLTINGSLTLNAPIPPGPYSYSPALLMVKPSAISSRKIIVSGICDINSQRFPVTCQYSEYLYDIPVGTYELIRSYGVMSGTFVSTYSYNGPPPSYPLYSFSCSIVNNGGYYSFMFTRIS
ncbi:MAG: hypothetical protein WCL00_14115, partial [Bacteroidota bacterium]